MISIEKAHKDDIPFVIDIENNSFGNPWSPEQIISAIEKTYLAKEDNIIKGFICIENVLDETHILHMAVHPDFRHQGIGKKLMLRAMEEPSNKFFLEVRESNLFAQSLYKNFGFKPVSARKNYYQDNDETALVMEYLRHV